MIWLHLWLLLTRFSLCMHRNGYLWDFSKNSDTAIQFLDHDFSIECKILVIWRFGYAESLTYFYFRFIRPTDPENVRHVLLVTMVTSTKFEVDMNYEHPLPNYIILAADTLLLCDLDLWPFDLGQCLPLWLTSLPSLKISGLSILELSVTTSSIGYHWQCIWSYCACTRSRNLCIGGQK